MFTQDDFSYIPIRSKSYNYFYKVNFDEDNPERTVKQCFSVLYDYGVFLYAVYLVLVDKDGYTQEGCHWYYPDMNSPDPRDHFEGVYFQDGFDDPDWIAIVTERENLEYTEKACERFLEIHPDNKYRELIAYMLDFAKKELNDLGLSEHEFKNE